MAIETTKEYKDKTISLQDDESRDFEIKEDQHVKLTGTVTGHATWLGYKITATTAKIVNTKTGTTIWTKKQRGEGSTNIDEKLSLSPGMYIASVTKDQAHQWGGGRMKISYKEPIYQQVEFEEDEEGEKVSEGEVVETSFDPIKKVSGIFSGEGGELSTTKILMYGGAGIAGLIGLIYLIRR